MPGRCRSRRTALLARRATRRALRDPRRGARRPMTTTSPAWEIARLDATAQADLVRRGEVTGVELVTWAIERIEQLNPTLNAVVTALFDQALEAAAVVPRGAPFAGV